MAIYKSFFGNNGGGAPRSASSYSPAMGGSGMPTQTGGARLADTGLGGPGPGNAAQPLMPNHAAPGGLGVSKLRGGGPGVAQQYQIRDPNFQLAQNRQAIADGQQRFNDALQGINSGQTLDRNGMMELIGRGPQGIQGLNPQAQAALKAYAQEQAGILGSQRDANLAQAAGMYGENFSGTAPDYQGFYNRLYDDGMRKFTPWLG